MGTCVSRPEACVGGGRRSSAEGKRKKRGRRMKRRVPSSRIRTMETIDEVNDAQQQLAVDNPTSRGSIEEAWFETIAIEESDCEEDFHSVQDDTHCFDNEYTCITLSFKDVKDGEIDQPQKSRKSEQSVGNSESSANNQSNGSLRSLKQFVTHEDISGLSVGECASKEEGEILDGCGSMLPIHCLPCIPTTALILEKRRSFTSSPPNSAKKGAPKLSFKRKSVEENVTPKIYSSKSVLVRPLAGSQVLFCPAEKKMLDCWSTIDPCTFRVRGKSYLRDKKKEFAPNHAAYYPFGVDVYLSQHKLNHIARFVELPTVNSFGQIPPVLVVNVQIPLYPAAIFQNETDGEGFSFVLYFKLSERYSEELPSHFLNSIRRLIDDEVEKVRSFGMDTVVPFRERLKILGRVANIEDLPLSAAEKALMHKYNEKPLLSRPQHDFYSGENYFEIDLDMHRFSYISRKGFETFMDRLKLCVLDVSLTIQGNNPEELPEQILCCVQLNGIDYTNYHPLSAQLP